MKVDLKKQLETRSYRVKGIDVHPTEPLLAASLYTGALQLWNYDTQQLVRSVDVSSVPARAVRFIPRKNWIAVGSDDMQIRVFHAATLEKVAQFEAHLDYIRALAVHPTLPILLSSSDDMLVKAWDWDRQWQCTQVFRGHQSYVLGLAINPKDPTQFATGSMDRTVKVWSLDAPTPNYTLEAHDERGVNYVAFYPFADKPYLLTTSDDRTVRVFDYQSKQVVATLVGHTHNVSFAVWHPSLPLIISGSEDSTLKLWNARSYKLEQTINVGMERAWCVAPKPDSNMLVVGFETGALALKLGRDEPVVSMDASGKLVWARQLEAFSGSVRGPAPEDGQVVHLQTKDLGAVEMQPSLLSHSPDGRYVAVSGDNDVVVYTALAWRSKFFTAGTDFCWGPDNTCAVLTSAGEVQVKRQFKDAYEVSVPGARRVFGGELLGVVVDEAVAFFDWRTGAQTAVLSVAARELLWSDDGAFLAVITDDVTHVLRVDLPRLEEGLEAGVADLSDVFEEVAELAREPVRSALWIGDCLVYTTASNRLNYLVGTETYNISHYDRDMYVVRYLPRDSSVYLCDKDVRVYSQQLSVAVVEFQTAVLRGDVDEAVETLLPKVPESELNGAARFLEAQGLRELALKITRDSAQKFELALALDRLDLAAGIAGPEEVSKWRQLGDHYLAQWNVDRAIEAYSHAKELDTLLLIHTSTGNKPGLLDLAARAENDGKYNLAFNALWSVGATPEIVALLNKSGRHAEAALFALTYGEGITGSVDQWKAALRAHGREQIADRIEVPETAPTETPAETTAETPAETIAETTVEAPAEATAETVAPAETTESPAEPAAEPETPAAAPDLADPAESPLESEQAEPTASEPTEPAEAEPAE